MEEQKKEEQKGPATRPLADNQTRPGYENLGGHSQKKQIQHVEPDSISAAPKEQKKARHGFRNFLITVAVVIIVLIVGIGATGLYVIPGVSNLFNFAEPRDLGVVPSAQALASLEEKIPMEIKADRRSYDSLSDIFTGTLPFDGQTTDVEITSFLDRFQGNNSIFSGTQVKFIEGGMEISSLVDYKIKAPVYAKVMVTQTGNKSIELTLAEGKVGLFQVPQTYLQAAEDFFEDKINQRMAEIDGFSMTTLEYHDGYSDFTGSFPQTVYSNDKGWSALFLD